MIQLPYHQPRHSRWIFGGGSEGRPIGETLSAKRFVPRQRLALQHTHVAPLALRAVTGLGRLATDELRILVCVVFDAVEERHQVAQSRLGSWEQDRGFLKVVGGVVSFIRSRESNSPSALTWIPCLPTWQPGT